MSDGGAPSRSAPSMRDGTPRSYQPSWFAPSPEMRAQREALSRERIYPEEAPYQYSRPFISYMATRAPWAVPRAEAVRGLNVAPSQRVPSGPRVAPISEFSEVSRAIREHIDTCTRRAASPAEVVHGPRAAPTPTTSHSPRAEPSARDVPVPVSVRFPGAARPLTIDPSQIFPSGPRAAPQSQYVEDSRAIRAFVDVPAPWAAPPPEIVHGPRAAPTPTASPMARAEPSDRDVTVPTVRLPGAFRAPRAEPSDRDVPMPVIILRPGTLHTPGAEPLDRAMLIQRTVRRPGAVHAANLAPSGIPYSRPILLPSTENRAPRVVRPPSIPTGSRFAYRSTPEEIARGFPQFQILSAPWAISPSGPPFEREIGPPPTPQGIPGIAPISPTTPAARRAMPSRDRPPETTASAAHGTSRRAQHLQSDGSTPHETLRRAQPLRTRPEASRRVLIETRPSTRRVTTRRVPPIGTHSSTSQEVSGGPQPLATSPAPGVVPSAKKTTAPIIVPLVKKTTAPMVDLQPKGGPSIQSGLSSTQTRKPQEEIDLFWTPAGIDPLHPEWNFPARIMQDYYIAKDEKKKLRAAKIAEISHLEEKLLDRACYELDITDDASFMEQLFGMPLKDISARLWKTAIFQGPVTSHEARYTKIFNMDMNIARLQNRHLRNHRHARRMKLGRVPQLPKPPKTSFAELSSRKANAEAAEAVEAIQQAARPEYHSAWYRRASAPPVLRPTRYVSQEIAGEARLAWHWTAEDWEKYREDVRQSKRIRGE